MRAAHTTSAFDANSAFDHTLQALADGRVPAWEVFLALGMILTFVVLIVAIPNARKISDAIAAQRKLSHRRSDQLRKVRNSIDDRRAKRAELETPKPPALPRPPTGGR